ncbi:MAG: hypothetical protein QMD99_08590 [Rhizobiaceae bacterium]|nr:hypothetical protein [Rhizobiaceae bacterium]
MNRQDALLVLFVGIGILSLTLATALPIDTTPIERSTPSQPSANTLQNEVSVGDGQLLELSDRPLMSPSRRPHLPETDPVPPEEPPMVEDLDNISDDPTSSPAALRLLGVELSASGKSALVATPESDEPTWIKIGEDLGGWQVVKIDAQSITLEPLEGASPPLTLPLYSEETPCEGC